MASQSQQIRNLQVQQLVAGSSATGTNSSSSSSTTQTSTSSTGSLDVVDPNLAREHTDSMQDDDHHHQQDYHQQQEYYGVYDDDDDEEEDDEGSEVSWIEWFCSLEGHDFFVEVAESFIEDEFNLTGLNMLVPYFQEALEMILDTGPEGRYSKSEMHIIETSAEKLYMLIHQRFIRTKQGQKLLLENYLGQVYGECPRVLCQQQSLLPVGMSEFPNEHTVSLFCPMCIDLYHPTHGKHQALDGCAFGQTAAHLLINTYPQQFEQVQFMWQRNALESVNIGTSIGSMQGTDRSQFSQGGVYVPRIYGFRINQKSKTAQRMKWLRRLNTAGVVQQSSAATRQSSGNHQDSHVSSVQNLASNSNLPSAASSSHQLSSMLRDDISHNQNA
ncbi:hypothetical protein MIR68_007076 [Amoeboaphelidium protococcarum]|nr:hypothetical protein MIR68_007076 [Amoeboaphelidium protococcarum]